MSKAKVNGKSRSVGFHTVMATYTTATYPSQMDNFRSNGQSPNCETKRQTSSGSDSPRGHVGFTHHRDEEKEKRQKYLTARYGQHQMTLIRKRLAVEDWLYEKLRTLHDCKIDTDDHDCELDLEEVLNLDTDQERIKYIQEELKNPKLSQDDINVFIEELLQKASTL
ncbi:protein phosphatase 1 regulatory subunit 14B-like [Mytilus edulis]|uniref:Protein phosphatase 1 regulatory subunit 14B n=2 Tax=Mytilus galloprovincialis TaxID=29158 RepID=A0A8B6E4L4_MYTGA|nr:protein phosphatase 1 regulatory subunit 14B [Mytilus galloprovincialis]VDI83045.1 protein phosphatase 1 regulatory subunit 14B [Mytilus galloprovincialis]